MGKPRGGDRGVVVCPGVPAGLQGTFSRYFGSGVHICRGLYGVVGLGEEGE